MNSLIFPLILIAVMIFFVTRTQKKQQAKQAQMQSQLQKGAKVVTIGGLHAVVDRINEADKTVDLDAEGVILTFEANAIRSVTAPEQAADQQPAQSADDDKADAADHKED
ncbi:preprotein translocase subunit YajC [Leuconostocaceae bacterium ESL0958]|nr:preprotein translocase subunit YajC [Leuconostocaceae bacterium ESL0958]